MERHPEPRTARAATRAPGDPARLFDVATLRQFAGAASAIALLESAADRAVQCGRVLEDTLIVGPPDSGKAVVARALARDAAQRTVEVDAAWARGTKHVARALRALEDRDALVVRRIDELRPGPMRMLVSMMAARTLPRELDAGPALADCTVIATAERIPRHGACLCRLFPLAVELPSPCADASVAAGFRAAVALGAPPTPEVRAAVERRIEAAAVGAWLAGRGSSAGASGRGGRVHGCPGMAVNLAAIARIVAAAG